MARKDRQEEIEEEKPNVMRELLGMLVYVGIVLAITFLIITFVGQRTHVSGESMENTLDDGDQLIVDKLTYRFHDPERFDIIVFPFRYKDNTYYIKRIIGMPGETVQIKDGKVYINDKELKSDVYGITDYIDYPGIAEEPITLGDDEYFCLGDNRPVSQDSRYEEVGPVKRSIIVGKVWIRIWPLTKFGKVS